MATDLSNRAAWIQGCFKQRFTLYREVMDTNSDGHGKPVHVGWATIYTDEPYYHQPTRNFDQPSVVGRILQPSSISAEWANFLPEHIVKEGDLFRGLNGNVYAILGPPTSFPGVPVPEAAFNQCEVRQEPVIPDDLPS